MPADPPQPAIPDDARLRELFERVADLDPNEIPAALDDAGATAQERSAVHTLLDADRADMMLLDGPALDWVRQLEDDRADIDLFIGQHAGPFRIAQFLGKGGSSMVFRATRPVSDGEQSVALKLLHAGLFAPESRRRFRREQSILAHLSHPNLARLIDAGVTESGVPYIAMELIHGKELIAHANDRALDRRARLRLLIEVCRAVEAAHRALIVHRDLKPSNVLVTAEGHVKVLDFGIAKLVDHEGAQRTLTEHIALTPGYAAPEQYEGGPITTSADVYALGVLAGELLIHTRLGPDATLEEPRNGGPRADGRRRWRALDRDLIEILRATLASDPERRYASAGHLADDLGRYLRREPLAVRPMSMWYRGRKFIARHRAGVGIASVLALALLVMVFNMIWQSHLAHMEAERATAARDFLVSIFEAAGADLPVDQRPSTQDLVERASDRLATQEGLGEPLRVDLLLALANVARNIGSYERARLLLDRAEPMIAQLYGEHDAPSVQAKVLRASVASGSQGAAEVIRLLEPLRADLIGRQDGIGVDGLVQLANAAMAQERIDESLLLLRTAESIAAARHLGELQLIATIKETRVLFEAHRFRDGLQRADAATALWKKQGEPTNPAMIDFYGNIALGAYASGDTVRAEAAFREAVALGERLFDKPNPKVASALMFFGSFLEAMGRYDEAERYQLRGLEMSRAVLGDADADTLDAMVSLGRLFYWEKKFDESLKWLNRGLDTCHERGIRDIVCTHLLALRARDYGRMNRFAEADRDIAQALARQRELTGDTVPAYAWVLDSLVCIQIAEGGYAEAVATADRILALRASAGGGLVQADLLTRFNRARALYELQRNDESLAELIVVEPAYSKLFPLTSARFDMLAFKARALDRAGQTSEAALVAEQALDLPARTMGDPDLVVALKQLAARPTDRSYPHPVASAERRRAKASDAIFTGTNR